MGRKVFISFLGYTNYDACHYRKDEFCSESTRYVQTATLDYLSHNSEWGENDAAFILLTKGAEAKNWVDNGHTDRETKKIIEQSGLETELRNKNYPFGIVPVREIPDGNTEEEIWEIFERVFELIQDEDELYFDLTHGFRYLPMLTLVLGNYAATLKKAHVKSITYGNFEGRNRNTEVAELIDLLPLSALQEWTFAAADYIDNGNTKHLKRLAEENYKPILKETRGGDSSANALKSLSLKLSELSDEIQTCRGKNIISGKTANTLLHAIDDLSGQIRVKPIIPIIDIIRFKIEPFSKKENVQNTYFAARWCLDNEQYQPAVTLIREGIVSYYCQKYGLNHLDEVAREMVTTAALHLSYRTLPKENEECRQQTILKIMDDKSLQNLKGSFSKLIEVRNDFNHSGMKDKTSSPKKLRNKTEQCMDEFGVLFGEKCVDPTSEPSTPSLLINFSNHASEKWSEEQMAEATRRFGNIVDFPFPEVNPSADEADIEDLAKKCVEQMRAMANGTVFAVHAMGEMTLTMAVVETLKNLGITCVASTTERIVNEISPDKKEVTFNFVRFREY